MRKKALVLSTGIFILLLIGLLVSHFHALKTGQKTAPAVAQKVTYYCPMHPNYTSDRPGNCPICGMTLVPQETGKSAEKPEQQATQQTPPVQKKKIMYRSTMIPDEVSDKPGKDSMGMEMVPFEVEEPTSGVRAGDRVPVKISPEKQQLMGVKTAVVARRSVTRTVRTVGKVAFDPELYQAEQEYLTALKNQQHMQTSSIPEMSVQANALVEAARLKLKLLGFTGSQIKNLEKAGVPDESLLVTDGRKNVWIEAQIYEPDLPDMKQGLRAVITIPSTGETFNGKLATIDPTLNPDTRSVRVRILVEQKQAVLKPELYVDVLIDVPGPEMLTVPEDAIIDTGTRKIVFLSKENGYFEPKEIKIGRKYGPYYGVISGLSGGEKVVVGANFLIDSESRLKAALSQPK